MTQYTNPFNLPYPEAGDPIAKDSGLSTEDSIRTDMRDLATAANRELSSLDLKTTERDNELSERDDELEARGDQQEARIKTVENKAVVTETETRTVLEFADEYGVVLATIEDIEGNPYLRGSTAAYGSPNTEDSYEVIDEYGEVIFAIDDLSNNPHFRGTGGGQGFTETHFIVLVGQSNSMGVGRPSPVGTNDPLSNLFYIPQRGAEAGQEVLAVEPLWHPYSDPLTSSIGHGWTVARKYALEHPNVRVVVLPMAMSGSGFFYSASPSYTWAPSRVGESGMNNLYELAISKCNSAISQYSGTKRVAMFLWHQGEADSVGETTQAQYEDEMQLLASGLRSNITNATDAIFIIGQLGWEFRNVRAPGTWAQIDAAHQNLPNLIPSSAFAPAPPQGHMNADNTHFTGLGQKLLAESFISVQRDAYYNI